MWIKRATRGEPKVRSARDSIHTGRSWLGVGQHLDTPAPVPSPSAGSTGDNTPQTPSLSRIGGTSADIAPHWLEPGPNMADLGPNPSDNNPTLVKLGRCRPKLAPWWNEVVSSADAGPNSAKSLGEVGQTCPVAGSHKPISGWCRPNLGRPRSNLDLTRRPRNLARCWGAVDHIWQEFVASVDAAGRYFFKSQYRCVVRTFAAWRSCGFPGTVLCCCCCCCHYIAPRRPSLGTICMLRLCLGHVGLGPCLYFWRRRVTFHIPPHPRSSESTRGESGMRAVHHGRAPSERQRPRRGEERAR